MPNGESNASEGESLLRFEDVTRQFQAGKHVVTALGGIDLEIDRGSFVVVAGPSGSGKSTLLNLAGCIDEPSRGTVRVANRDPTEMGDREASRFRSRHIGFVFQSFNLIPVLTVYENVEYALRIGRRMDERAIRERTREIIGRVGLEDQVDQRPGELSGGEQQRVSVARALVTQPDLVLADEPTANLDSKTGERILELMQDLQQRENTSLVVATHDPMVMERACRKLELHDGRIVSDSGNPPREDTP